jgi:hypothetical protein
MFIYLFIYLVKQVPGWGLEQRESEKTVLFLQIMIIFISYIIIYIIIIIIIIKLLIIENHPSPNRKQNSLFVCFQFVVQFQLRCI